MRKLCFLAFMLCTCKIMAQTKNHSISSDNLLEQLMQTKPSEFGAILQNSDSLRVQIVYTKIDRTAKNKPVLTEYRFNTKDDLYFYPASTVKMTLAFLALEKLNEMKKKGVNKFTRTVHEQILPNYTIENDSASSIAHYIKQIFLVSDNEAFNRLYEFVGQEAIQQKLSEKGYPNAIIRHRLQRPLSLEHNKITNPISFYNPDGELLFRQAETYSRAQYNTSSVYVGKGYYKGDSLVNKPFEFTEKNRVYLTDLHHMLQSVIFPETVTKKQRFNLTEDDYDFVYKYMSMYPAESKVPYYPKKDYWDSYCKFLYYGSEEKTPVNSSVRIFNKVGDAYGFLTDIAYVIDTTNQIEYMLSATIYCNSDGIFNDDTYDYEKLGFPFMKHLGQLIHAYEIQRKREHKPKLEKFLLNYSN